MKAYTEIIRGLRENRELKQTTVANALGIVQQQYSNYETGVTEMPIRILQALADYYGVSTDYILGRTDSREGVDGLNKTILGGYTTGRLISDTLSLSRHGQAAVIEYVGLQRIKENKE